MSWWSRISALEGDLTLLPDFMYERAIRTAIRDLRYGLENFLSIAEWLPVLLEQGPRGAFEVISRLNDEDRLRGWDETPDFVRFQFGDPARSIKFTRGYLPMQEVYNGVYACFVKEEYHGGRMEFYRGRSVLDMGLTFGDSVMYAISRGAKRVVGVEPDPSFATLASTNVHLNGAGDLLTLIRGMIADKTEERRISFAENKGVDVLKATSAGTIVQAYSPDDVIRLAALEGTDNILKSDTEGAEYSFRGCPYGTFDPFSDLLIEYHAGFEVLERLFHPMGFRTMHRTGPYTDRRHSGFGIIHLTRGARR